MMPPQMPPQMGPGQIPGSATAGEEASALKKVMWFAIIQLAGTVAGWVGAYYVFSSVFFNTTFFNSLPANPTSAQVAAALGPLFQDVVYLIPLALGIGLAALVVLTLGFRGLARVDSGRFHISTPFMIIMIVGLLLVGGGAAALVTSVPSIISNAPFTCLSPCTPSTAFLNQMSSLIAYFGLIAIGGLLALIGVIGGMILGLWRVGSRYNQTTIKIGAIFEIIPLLNIVAPILILLGAMEARNMVSK